MQDNKREVVQQRRINYASVMLKTIFVGFIVLTNIAKYLHSIVSYHTIFDGLFVLGESQPLCVGIVRLLL